MVSEFQTITSDHEIRRILENRKQKFRESFSEFKLAVEEINSRLDNPYTEAELVSLLKFNMHPALRKNLWLHEPRTMRDLKTLCMQIEKGLADIGEALDEQLVTKKLVANEVLFNEGHETSFSVENSVEENLLMICWNCRDIGHNFMDCPVEQQHIFSFKCGTPGVTRPNCIKCNRLNRPVDVRLGSPCRPSVVSQNKHPQILKRRSNQATQTSQTETQ